MFYENLLAMRLHIGVYREGALFYFDTERRKFQHTETVELQTVKLTSFSVTLLLL